MKDFDDLEDERDTLHIENQVLTEELESEQKKALIRELRAKYGKNWRKVLGNLRNSESLKQFGGTRFKLT